MFEQPPRPPQAPVTELPAPSAVPSREHFASRYGNMLVGQRTTTPEGGEFTPPQAPSVEGDSPYRVEASIENGDIDDIRMAIGELLVDVGQKIDDEGLINDAESIFHVTPETAAAAAHARTQWEQIEADAADEDDGNVISLSKRRAARKADAAAKNDKKAA